MVFWIWKGILRVRDPRQEICPAHLAIRHSTADFGNEVVDTDKVLQAFFDGCHKAGPTACAFYANSPAAIAHKLDALYQKVLVQPVPAYSPDLPLYGYVDHPTLKNAIFTTFYSPYDTFSALAEGLALLEKGNGSIVYQLSVPRIAEATMAIICVDAAKVTDDAAKLKAHVQSIDHISNFASTIAGLRLVCSWVVHNRRLRTTGSLTMSLGVGG